MELINWMDSIWTNGQTRRLPIHLFDTVLTWIERARERRVLAKLDERMLKDIGLSPLEAWVEAAKPGWKD